MQYLALNNANVHVSGSFDTYLMFCMFWACIFSDPSPQSDRRTVRREESPETGGSKLQICKKLRQRELCTKRHRFYCALAAVGGGN